jgi:hypothetical protein
MWGCDRCVRASCRAIAAVIAANGVIVAYVLMAWAEDTKPAATTAGAEPQKRD